jgi:hypothetical protein
MRARIWSSICIVAVLAVTGSAAFAQGHRGAGQSQSQFQNQQQQTFQSQQQSRQNITDQYIQNDRLQGDRNGQYFQSQSRFNDHDSQVRGGWNEGYRDYRAPVIQRYQAPGWGFQVQLGTGFDRDMRNEYRPLTNDRGFHSSDHTRAYR